MLLEFMIILHQGLHKAHGLGFVHGNLKTQQYPDQKIGSWGNEGMDNGIWSSQDTCNG